MHLRSLALTLWLPALGLLSLNGCGARSDTLEVGAGGTASTSSTVTTSTGGPSTTSGLGEQFCGDGYPPCETDNFCEFPGATCLGEGICIAKPQGCDEDCSGVCGCDGEFYCNTCMARQAGVDAGPDSLCGETDDTAYFAEIWAGGLDHLVIMQANYTKDTCIRVYLTSPASSPNYAISAPGAWAVDNIFGGTGAAGCEDSQSPIANEEFAYTGTGNIDFEIGLNMYFPCELDVQAQIEFTPQSPTFAGSLLFDGFDVPVNNGCE